MASKSAARPSLVSPRSQLIITFSIAAVQIVATVVWCLIHLPGMASLCPPASSQCDNKIVNYKRLAAMEMRISRPMLYIIHLKMKITKTIYHLQ